MSRRVWNLLEQPVGPVRRTGSSSALQGVASFEIRRESNLDLRLDGKGGVDLDRGKVGGLIANKDWLEGRDASGRSINVSNLFVTRRSGGMPPTFEAIVPDGFAVEVATGVPHRLTDAYLNGPGIGLPHRTVQAAGSKVLRRQGLGDSTTVGNRAQVSMDHLGLAVPGLPPCVFGVLPRDTVGGTRERAFIEYDVTATAPTETQRANLASAIGFVFGGPLALVGAVTSDSNGNVLTYQAQSPDFAAGHPGPRPAPVADVFEPGTDRRFADGGKASRVISAVYRAVGTYDLAVPFGLFWYAISSPVDYAPALYGAALEGLKQSYYDHHGAPNEQLFSASEWATISDSLAKAVNGLCGPGGLDRKSVEVQTLLSKLRNQNKKGFKRLFAEFFDAIGMRVGKVEMDALLARHGAAHGATGSAHLEQMLHLANAQRTMFARALLLMSGCTDEYVDFSTIGHPLRPSGDPQGGPT